VGSVRSTWKSVLLISLWVSIAGCTTPLPQPRPSSSTASAAGEIIEEVRLDASSFLVVRRRDDDRTVSVEIAFTDRRHIVKRYTVGNGWFEKGFMTAVNLDPSSNDPEYLVRVPDRTSTYGAEFGIIVYRLRWWEFLLIPDDRFSVEDIDGDGLLEVTCQRIQTKSYSLFQGVLHEKVDR
jgi:hypothetical protein